MNRSTHQGATCSRLHNSPLQDGVNDASTNPLPGSCKVRGASSKVVLYSTGTCLQFLMLLQLALTKSISTLLNSPLAQPLQSMPVCTVPRRDWPYKKAPTEYTLLYEGHVLAVSLADNKVMYPWDPPRGPTLQSIPVRSEVRRDFVDEKPRIKSSVSLTLSNPEESAVETPIFLNIFKVTTERLDEVGVYTRDESFNSKEQGIYDEIVWKILVRPGYTPYKWHKSCGLIFLIFRFVDAGASDLK